MKVSDLLETFTPKLGDLVRHDAHTNSKSNVQYVFISKSGSNAIIQKRTSGARKLVPFDELTFVGGSVKVTEAVDLSTTQKKKLIADFKEWSGGFTPDECPWEGDDENEMSVSQYIEHAVNADLPKEAVKEYLKSLCESLTEDRIKSATYTTHEVKGKVEKVIAELKGQHSSAWTKISKQYVELDTEIKTLEEQRTKLNVELKDKARDVFNVEDEILTRVVETAQLTLTLSKKFQKGSVPEVDAVGVVQALAEADLPKELRKIISTIIKANTKMSKPSETPERLTVKVNKVEESINSIVVGIILTIKSWLKIFDARYNRLEKMVKALG